MGLGPATARTVLLATGVTNRRPPMDEGLHDEALARGLIRYCPICDGYEVTDRKVGVIGSGSARRRRGGLPARLHRRHHPDRAGQRPRLAAEDQERLRGARHRDGRRPLPRGRGAGRWRSSSRRRTAIIPSTASIRLWARTCTASWPARSASRSAARPAASSSTRTSAPTCPAPMRRATSCSASTRSATPWAKAGSRRRRSATIWRSKAVSSCMRHPAKAGSPAFLALKEQ